MTTVAYSFPHRMIAADRQVTAGGVMMGTATKIFKRGPLVAGVCGAGAMINRFLSWFAKGCIGDPPDLMAEGPDGKMDGIGVIFMDDLAVEFIQGGIQTLHHPFHCYGSGSDIARAILSAGHSPIEAIEHASKLDIYTGHGIDVLRF